MYIFLIIIHVIVCIVLIAVILLQAGRGGGFSDLAGGTQTQSIFGTQTNAFKTRATEVCAVLFIVTSLSLGVLSTQRGKSLMAKQRLMDSVRSSVPPPAAKQQDGPVLASGKAGAPAPSAEAASPVADTTPAPAKSN